MFKRIRGKIISLLSLISAYVMVFTSKAYAVTTPDEDEVNEIASKGLKLFFGALAGFAIVMGVIEFYGAFMAFRENEQQGGYGGAQNRVGKKIFAGIMCLIGAGIAFVGLRWTQSLFDLA